MTVSTGDQAPVFNLPDQYGNDFCLADHIGKENILLYFYPKDETPGCITESCEFRDNIAEFAKHDCKVIGISKDSVSSHAKFSKHYDLPFILLSDADNEVRRQYGVSGAIFGLLPGRKTYLIDKEGIVTHIFEYQFQAKKHIVESLKALANE